MGVEDLVFGLVGISRLEGEHEAAPLRGLRKLFNEARSSIKIVTGEFPYTVYCSDGLSVASKEALKRGCAIEVVVGPKADIRSQEALQSIGVPVYVLPHWPSPHFIVVDDKHVRVEEPHEEGEKKKRVQYIIHNFKYAQEYVNRFNSLKKQAKLRGLADAAS